MIRRCHGKSISTIAKHTKVRAPRNDVLTSLLTETLGTQKSSLIFLEDKEKLDFVTTRLQMVLNDSSLYTHKARKDILDSYLGFDGAIKQHIFIGSYSFNWKISHE